MAFIEKLEEVTPVAVCLAPEASGGLEVPNFLGCTEGSALN